MKLPIANTDLTYPNITISNFDLKAIEKYKTRITDIPTTTCFCCKRLCFTHQIKKKIDPLPLTFIKEFGQLSASHTIKLCKGCYCEAIKK